ncbi:uncharacterized protein LOC100160226 [Acyrthosiphon pisum]|uniref:ACYPI001541 protein n=1 Tax=Acyrthosiphon pisum TaxID=7029 RepID=C4WT05_ACYPI|nr:uncharacterized protein LOC100160226 [Acyrthosiphon pisum]BAH71025.1 ACYPI001541 [Acyrthosiphon pisum]|eukprot:NP_001233093.1 uncharacterized protein LOC100160226 [Acyrthosiphon pisum]
MNMKFYIIKPLYTALFSVIIFAALSSSFSDLKYFTTEDGKEYVNSTYEIVRGGNKVLFIDSYSIPGLESYRKLTPKEKLVVQNLQKSGKGGKLRVAGNNKEQSEKERQQRDAINKEDRRQHDAEKEKERRQSNRGKGVTNFNITKKYNIFSCITSLLRRIFKL